MAKTKMTPVARFLIAMLIIVPVAFLGASYITGSDPVESVKDIFSSDDGESKTSTTKSVEKMEEGEKIEHLEKENRLKDERIDELNDKIDDLNKELNNKVEEIKRLNAN